MKRALVALLCLASTQASANIVCRAQTSMGEAKIDIAESTVTVSGAALEQAEVYSRVDGVWDGHETELITAPGLSISYQDWYGCIHNAKITANFRTSPGLIETVDVAQCSGGSTSDSVCHAK
jgi:hypothetical protein